MKISVIVASHRSDFIANLLDSLAAQSLDPAEFEVIVAADYKIETLQHRYPHIRWEFLDDHSISAKRNKGVFHSRADILAFIDDDCIADPNWLKNAYDYLSAHPECAAVEGFTSIETAVANTGLLKEYKRLEKPGFRTNNIFYRRELFVKVGGFDERFSVQREDADLAFSVIENGGKIDFCSDIRVKHRFRYWERWDLLKNCWNRRFDPLLYKKHPQLYRKYIRTPLTPSIIALSGTYLLLILASFFSVTRIKSVILINTFIIPVLAFRRTGWINFSLEYLFFNLISVSLAPLVVVLALLTGSIRFKKILII
ncbi:MAG: glycosyltransferase [Fibrobacter sp.]|nr:glycosyltransferase [Fibrobacter sp.]